MRDESSRTHDVFLSYSSKDKTWADAACAVLERHRIRCWIAPRDITPGDEWGAAIMKGLNGSRIMVLIFSGHANASEQVRREVERAISQGMTVLPVRVEDVRPDGAMEFALGNRHWLDAFTPPVERQLELLARSVKTLLANDTEPAAGPLEPGDKLPRAKVDVPPTRWPAWVWPSVVAGVLMIGLLAAWLGGVFRERTPDGRAIGNEDPELKTETVLSRADAKVASKQIVNSIGMKLVLIPAGTFQMGSPDGVGEGDEHPQHEVRITRPFYLGVTEVTQAQYEAVMGNNPSCFSQRAVARTRSLASLPGSIPLRTSPGSMR